MSFQLTLTFDNGPMAATPIVLDLLAQYQVKATFFVCGKQMVRPVLREYADVEACAARLVDLALRAGGPDNITAIVAEVVGDEPPEPGLRERLRAWLDRRSEVGARLPTA